MSKYILNSAVLTAPGSYHYRLVSVAEAKRWLDAGGWKSTIGYEQTAEALSALTGVQVPVDRVSIEMEPGDEALVFRLKFPPGTPRIAPGDKGRLKQLLLGGHWELGIIQRTELGTAVVDKRKGSRSMMEDEQ